MQSQIGLIALITDFVILLRADGANKLCEKADLREN